MSHPLIDAIDKACGVTAEDKARWKAQRETEERQTAIVGELLDAAEAWYYDGRKNRSRLKRAVRAMLDEDERQ